MLDIAKAILIIGILLILLTLVILIFIVKVICDYLAKKTAEQVGREIREIIKEERYSRCDNKKEDTP